MLFREISFLEDYAAKYPSLPLGEIIESDYRLVFECLDILLVAIDLVIAGNEIDVDTHYLASDLQKLSEYLGEKDSLYRVLVDEKLNGIDIENQKPQDKLSLYKTMLQEYYCKKGV